MKKLFFIFLLTFLLIPPTAFASPQFDEVLSDKIKEHGVFNSATGIVYAGTKNFENRDSLFIVYITESSIICEVYDNSDGIQCTDMLEFPYIGGSAYKIAVVSKDGRDYVLFSTTANSKTTNEFFTMQNDTFTRTDKIEYNSITYIAGYEKSKVTSYVSAKNVFLFLNELKQDTIAKYPFENKTDTISAEDAQDIKAFLSACADIMSFDINNYDYDKLFKYVLYTHKNFQILTDIPSESGRSSSFGYNNVSIVSSNYIDTIMQNVFRLTPEKPPVNSLLSRGFCYNDGYYYYTGGFDTYFATDILDLIGVYDIDEVNIFVVFSDIYYENNTEMPEYSFAVLQKADSGYSLLRLGMGENLPSYEELKNYSKNQITPTLVPEDTKTAHNGLPMYVLFSIISVGIIGFILGLSALIRQIRK